MAYQPPVMSTFLSEQISTRHPANEQTLDYKFIAKFLKFRHIKIKGLLSS
jgi:hypothetical protein